MFEILKTNSVVIAIVVVLIATLVACISVKMLGNDNAIEEQMEQLIQDQTGLDIDLTPDSPETQIG